MPGPPKLGIDKTPSSSASVHRPTYSELPRPLDYVHLYM